MQNSYITLIIIAIIFLLIILISNYKKKTLPNGNLFKKQCVLNKTEKFLFQKLKIAFPEFNIFVQVPFSCIVTSKTCFYRKKQKFFWKINQKRVDFLICDENLNSLFIIELDGSSHNNKKHIDRERDEFFKKCGINTIRFQVQELKSLTPETIREAIKSIKLDTKVRV